MSNLKMQEIDRLIDNKQLDKAQLELSKLGEEFLKNCTLNWVEA